MTRIKVVLSAIWYPMAMARYVWEALDRRKDVDLWVVGPFTGDWIPWNGGMRLPMKYVRTPDLAMPLGDTSPSPNIANQLLPWQPDIWIQMDAGFHFNKRPKTNLAVHIQTDPHVLKPFYAVPKSYSDINFCMQNVYIEGNEKYLPYAYDPTVHYPMPDIEKIYDACLLGLHYNTRNQLVNSLQSNGLKVRYGIGEIFDEFRLAYNQSKIALSWSSLLDIPTRVFEAMGMGIPLVANRVPDMGIFFKEGHDYLGFDNLEEATHQVLNLLQDDVFREMMAAHALAIIQPHTWDARVEQILKEAKLL